MKEYKEKLKKAIKPVHPKDPVLNYDKQGPRAMSDEQRKRGAEREHLKFTDATEKKVWIYHSPKLSRPEFMELLKCKTFSEYYNQVMKPIFEEYKKILELLPVPIKL